MCGFIQRYNIHYKLLIFVCQEILNIVSSTLILILKVFFFRDGNYGDVIGALSMPIPLSQLEALACRRAVQFALENGLRRVTFEGDLVTVINAIVRRSPKFLPYENVIDDIRFQTSGFQFSDFCHVKCNCNIVADTLAKKAKHCTGLQV